jgi:DNA-binding MarR family transcriptional regulator
MIQDTSLQAWVKTQEKLGYAQKQVLTAIRQYPNSTNNEIAGILDWQINRVTGRVNELRKIGVVIDAGKRTDRITGSNAHIWKEKGYPEAFPKKVETNQTLF